MIALLIQHNNHPLCYLAFVNHGSQKIAVSTNPTMRQLFVLNSKFSYSHYTTTVCTEKQGVFNDYMRESAMNL